MVMTRDEAKKILGKVLGYSKAEGCVANLGSNEQGNVRYARNTVTTSGTVSNVNLAIQSNYGKRSGVATVNELDDASLEKVVRRAEALAKLAPENPEFMPPLKPKEAEGGYPETPAWVDATAAIDPAYRARAAASSIEPSRKKKLVAAGYLEDGQGFQAMMNSEGLFAYQPSTEVEFSLTVRTEDGTGSGWVQRDFNDAKKLDTAALSAIAIDKAERSKGARAIEPGKYTVILEPAAAADLLQFMFFSFDARSADEGRSFLAKAGGGTRMGEKLVDERVTIWSDPTHPEVPDATWTGDGQRRDKTVWIEKGVVKNLFYSRYWAKEKKKKPVPQPGGGIMNGGEASLEELIAGTERGILVTRLWYNRMVDPQTVLATGLTRDGTFFIEKGKIAFPIKNLRYNESPIIMLNNIEALGRPQRTGGSLIPSMKIRDFTFTSLSDAV